MNIKLTDIVKEPGVADLPFRVRAQFARAIKAEREGRDEDALKALDAAVELDA